MSCGTTCERKALACGPASDDLTMRAAQERDPQNFRWARRTQRIRRDDTALPLSAGSCAALGLARHFARFRAALLP
eukprot:6367120-Pyramimonas_sp.AAC.1